MHREVELNLPHVKTAKLYVEAGGQSIIHVWTGLSSTDSEALHTLYHDLDGLIGKETGYTAYVVHPEDVDNAPRP